MTRPGKQKQKQEKAGGAGAREVCVAAVRGAVCYVVSCLVLVVLWSLVVDLLAHPVVRSLLGSVLSVFSSRGA